MRTFICILSALLVIGSGAAQLGAQTDPGLSVQVAATTAGTAAWLIEQKQILELPLNGRNYIQLIMLAPGVQSTGAGSAFYGLQQNFSATGARPEGQEYLLDNTNIQGFWNHAAGSGVLGTTLGAEAISEFSVQTTTYDAQFGGIGAGVHAVTRSGANKLHGSLYNYLRNDKLDARGLFDPAVLPEFRKNQFGGSLGGPIKKDKAFFFFNYEGSRQLAGGSNVVDVPDDNARIGLLTSGGLTTPLPNGVNPAVKPLLQYYPRATRNVLDSFGNPTGIGTATTVANDIGGENYFTGRADYAVSPKDSFFVRYVHDGGNLNQPFSGSAIPLWSEQDGTGNHYFTIEETRRLSPSAVNVLRFSFVRTKETMEAANNTPGLSFYPGRQNGGITIGGLTGLGYSNFMPSSIVQNKFAYADEVSWNHGPHSIKFGGYLERVQSNVNPQASFGGQFTFGSLTSFLLNSATSFSGPLPGMDDAYRDFREVDVPLYLNDDWRATRRLTLSLGLRYHFVTNPVTDKHPLYTLVDPPHSTAFEQVPNVFASNPNTKNFDPRFGFAYDPFRDHKTEVRGGFGIFHNPLSPRSYASAYYSNPPYIVATQSAPKFPAVFTSTSPALPSLAQGVDYQSSASPYAMQWSLNVQREVMDGAIFTIGYVGSRGVHLMEQRDLNPPTPIAGAGGMPTFGALAAIRVNPFPRANPNFGVLNSAAPDANSNYNSLQTSVSRRFLHNVEAQASYTWSRCFDEGSGASALEGGNPQVNPYDRSADYGPCDFDRRQAVRTSGIWSLPFRGNKLIQGWQLSGIGVFATGTPFSPTIGFDRAGLQNVALVERPNLLAGLTAKDTTLKELNKWFDPTVFTLPPNGQLGHLGRNTFTGPNSWNADFGLSKSTTISERFAVQFRAEFFNAFNHANWGMPTTAILTAGSNGAGNSNPLAGRIQSQAGDARKIQLALRLVF